MEWLGGEGASYLFDYLLKLDLNGFRPQGHAPVTDSKKEMIENGRSDLGSWVAMLREQPDQVLHVANKGLDYKLWTTAELFRIYDPSEKSRVTANGLARELRRGGFEKACNGVTIKTTSAGYQRLWIIREVGKLAKPAQYAEIYDKERGNATTGKRKF
jgi:hypothetical protein